MMDADPRTGPVPQPSRGYLIAKRVMDVVICGVGLVLLSPLLALIALWVKMDSQGPVLFKQLRIGRHQKPFYCLKFRSMTVDAEARRRELEHLNEVDGPVFKIRDDPRVTRAGRILRKLSLDEFPQLWNVMTGEMTLVGPRPPLPAEVEKYEPWMLQRLEVTPGITCFWQISGRSNVTFDEWMRMDLDYIRQCSIMTDIKILVRTIPAVLFGKGAY
ncbi:MAG: sugar transferase [Armatimonadetes bacterium]|jgi:lipopolysaccharide/colanic/teichoic acid biosynthesis glycosyltransferase|nr:sugar transferase [Armatimonadota bacterium]